MATTPGNIAPNGLIDPVQLAALVGIIYTSPVTTGSVTALGTTLLNIHCANDTTTDVTFTLYAVPFGGSPGDGNIIVKNVTLNSYGYWDYPGPIDIEPGGTLQAVASSANQVTLLLFGEVKSS